MINTDETQASAGFGLLARKLTSKERGPWHVHLRYIFKVAKAEQRWRFIEGYGNKGVSRTGIASAAGLDGRSSIQNCV